MSVLKQTYINIELILVDDASRDGSVEKIKALKSAYPFISIILLEENQGNCKAFNTGLQKARGEYIIDLAADDILLPDRIEKQVSFFEKLDKTYGVVFTDAVYIDGNGKFTRNHYEHLSRKNLLKKIPEGDVYRHVLTDYFIASPTMMMRREVLEKLNGYDENLVYEDFDFWVRSARVYKYAFLNEKLTYIRKTGKSMSSKVYKQGDDQLHSTYLVCRKAVFLNKTPDDKKALIWRVRYELRQSVFSDNPREATLFYELLAELEEITCMDKIIIVINKLPIRTAWMRRLYHFFRYR